MSPEDLKQQLAELFPKTLIGNFIITTWLYIMVVGLGPLKALKPLMAVTMFISDVYICHHIRLYYLPRIYSTVKLFPDVIFSWLVPFLSLLSLNPPQEILIEYAIVSFFPILYVYKTFMTPPVKEELDSFEFDYSSLRVMLPEKKLRILIARQIACEVYDEFVKKIIDKLENYIIEPEPIELAVKNPLFLQNYYRVQNDKLQEITADLEELVTTTCDLVLCHYKLTPIWGKETTTISSTYGYTTSATSFMSSISPLELQEKSSSEFHLAHNPNLSRPGTPHQTMTESITFPRDPSYIVRRNYADKFANREYSPGKLVACSRTSDGFLLREEDIKYAQLRNHKCLRRYFFKICTLKKMMIRNGWTVSGHSSSFSSSD